MIYTIDLGAQPKEDEQLTVLMMLRHVGRSTLIM